MNDKQKALDLMFNPGETYCSGTQYDTSADSIPRGPLITLNPVTKSRRDTNVTAHRNILVEMDTGTLDEQLNAMKDVPWSVCTYSGGKSLHFIICLEDDIDPILWRTWAKALTKIVPNADQNVTNPSRFTRLAGCIRPETEKYQELIEVRQRVKNETFMTWIMDKIPKMTTLEPRTGTGNIFEAHPLTHAFISSRHPVHRTGKDRNIALFRCAADLNNIGISFERASKLLTNPARELGLDDQEIDRTIESAFKGAM